MTLPMPAIPYTLLQAIAREEGFYDPNQANNRPQRNCNPGDLEWRPWMEAFGSTRGDPRFAIFPNPDLGFKALRHLLGFSIYKGKTIAQFVNTFAPGNENDTKQYTLNVCSWVERDPDTVIDGILG